MRTWARVFAVGSLIHIMLPDFEQVGWGPPAVLEATGALILLFRPHPLAFGLCFAGTLWPLLALRDVLTQSAMLTVFAAVGVIGAGTRWRGALDAVRLTTAATYALAALHKLNETFFDPTYSCANHAWAQVLDRYPLLDVLPVPPDGLPWFVVAIEIALAVLIVRRSPWMWPVGLAFHLPLTVTLAPAFGAVMAIGYAAAVTPRGWVGLRRRWHDRWPRIVGLGVLAGLAEVICARELEIGPGLKVVAAGMLLAWTWPPPSPHRAGRPSGVGARVVAALWVVHGLTPYVGVQYQHTAAMLSNLRIDAGCHNSLVFPEAWRGVDPYIRVDRASFGSGLRPRKAQRVRDTLWNIAALHTMRRNWCIPELRPIRYEGTWRGRAFTVEDLCAENALDALPGAGRSPPGFQRFQKNLPRACPAACIH